MFFHIHPPQKGYALAMNVFPLKDIIAVRQSTVFTDMFKLPLRKNSASTSNKHLALLKSNGEEDLMSQSEFGACPNNTDEGP